MKKSFRPTDVRPDHKREVGDELQFHIDMRTQEFIDAGMSPEDARRAAAQVFGDRSAIDAELRVGRALRTRSQQRRDWLAELASDVSFALRTLRKNFAFTAAALATLALGIGAATAVFTVVDGVLLRPLPYGDPARLGMVWLSGKEGAELPLSSGFYNDVEKNNTTFSSVAAFRSRPTTITSDGEPEQFAGARVTPSLFTVLGVRPLLGRAFSNTDAEPGAPRTVMISHALWQGRFGGSPTIVNKRIELGGEPFTVIGVMPPGFGFPRGAELLTGLQFGTRTDLWTPMSFSPSERRSYNTMNLAAIGRLKPNASLAQAHGELSAALQNFLRANAPTLSLDFRVVSLKEQAGQHVSRGLYLLMGAVAFLLFIACANVINLLVARTAARRREFAVRAALGAGRSRIARQLMTENVLLATIGTALGIALSLWATKAMLALVPGSMPRADDVRLDWRVGLVAAAIAIAVGAAFGLAATLQVTWRRLAGTLNDANARATGGRTRRLGRRALVVAEVSLSLMLIIGAGLLTASFVRLQRVEPGFDPHGALTAAVSLPITGGFEPVRDAPQWARFFQQLVDRLSKSPGVIAAGATSALPVTSTVEGGGTAIVGKPAPASGQALNANYLVVEGDMFRAAGIKLLRGRVFNSGDLATSPLVAVVNREYERRYLDGNAIGKQVNTYFDFANGAARTIVGVVDNVQYRTLDAEAWPQIYVTQQQMSYPGLNIIVRTQGDPAAFLSVLKREVKAIDPRLAISNPRTLDDVFDESLARRRFSMTLIGIFAASALVLAMVGLYGVIALSVSHRQREIGVRMALGARPTDVLRMVLGEGVRITLAGLVAGLVGAYALSRLVDSLLFGVSATSAWIYAAATGTIIGVTLVASYLPARRATRVDPTSALRAD